MWRIVAIGAAWTSVWWLIIGAILAPIVPGGGMTIGVATLLAVAPLVVLVRRFRGAYPSAFVRRWVFRPFWYAQLAAPLVALAGLLGVLAGAPFGAPRVAGQYVLLGFAAAFIVAAGAGYVGSRQLRVKALDARFVHLPAGLEGMRIVQLSDLHVGPHTPRRYLGRVVATVDQLRPDLIAITGDQVDDFPGDVAHFAAAFTTLSAPHGVFAVPGNHDVYAGWAEVRAGLERMGITVLVNDAIELEHGSQRFWVAGTGDPAGRGRARGSSDVAPDIARTLARVPAGAFTIALAHNPGLWPALAQRGVELTLSGHTHYGQLSIPRMGWSLASLFLEHAMGWHSRGNALLYISPGTNYWGLPLRLGALPEVTVLTLRRAERHQAEITPAREVLSRH